MILESVLPTNKHMFRPTRERRIQIYYYRKSIGRVCQWRCMRKRVRMCACVSVVLCCIYSASFRVALCCAVLCCDVLRYGVLWRVVFSCVVLCLLVLCLAVVCCGILRCVALRCVVSYCVVCVAVL